LPSEVVMFADLIHEIADRAGCNRQAEQRFLLGAGEAGLL